MQHLRAIAHHVVRSAIDHLKSSPRTPVRGQVLIGRCCYTQEAQSFVDSASGLPDDLTLSKY